MTIVRSVSRMSPSVRVNVAAARSTSAVGGVSTTKRRASFVAMNRAVAGCRARRSSTCFAVLDAAAGGERMPEDQLRARIVHLGAEHEAAALRRTRFSVQPVSARATSMTSSCV